MANVDRCILSFELDFIEAGIIVFHCNFPKIQYTIKYAIYKH